ncbi:hypothetical protein EC973_004392 [Apophysomyces ossiformis]|uniref:Neutral ceramidase n=1 Tax=Apophysomyces ossiformis TaxID=679940 RepID=A0A8H7EUW4_9FUNG|nr:hypothetical protein EC973_004392 [Apophysomyces ossiformis]
MFFSPIFLALYAATVAAYQIGTGIADITGPVTDILFMGYANLSQTGEGILQRLYARAFIVADNDKRIVFVNTDTQSMGEIVKQRVIAGLQDLYGDLYTEQNVMLSSTHSHSGMGGYLQYTLYEISVLGWIEETTRPMVNGIVRSIIQAHNNLEEGSVTLSRGELLNTNINRSPAAYLLNPVEERSQYKYDVDKDMTMLGFKGLQSKQDLGLISWFAVHGVSVNGTNRLVNGDNKGYAAYAVERKINQGLPGKGPFVAAFAQANEGDVSPNTLGAFCTGTNIPCDGSRDTRCPSGSTCSGRGPAWQVSDYESNRIIGQNQADKALELFLQQPLTVLNGPIDYRQMFWDITNETLRRSDGSISGSLCLPAMGYAFAAGTTDGPALDGFYQNTTEGVRFWDTIKNFIRKPTKEQIECQKPKPILLDTGEIKIPYDWQPKILDIQLLRIGNVFIAGVPSEMTTMSGRRLRQAIKAVLEKHGVGENITVIQSGPANGYASYCTTYEEYQMQRYEGASTPYGPHTLEAYIQAFEVLATAMATGKPVSGLPSIPDYTKRAFHWLPRLGGDRPKLFRNFGDVIRDVHPVYLRTTRPTVTAVFVAGNPRNDVMAEKTFLTVERKDESSGEWKVVRTDSDYDTM